MPHRPTLIVAAMPNELSPTVRRLSLRRTGDRRFSDASGALQAAIIGVGPKRCAPALSALLTELEPERVIAIGVAGGLNPALRDGDVVVPSHVVDDVTGDVFSCRGKEDRRIVSVEHGVFTVEGKAGLRKRTNADAVDMESATIARLCEGAEVEWQCVRAISDPANVALPKHITRMLGVNGVSIPRVIQFIVTHPTTVPLLVRLGRITKRCTAALAEHVASAV